MTIIITNLKPKYKSDAIRLGAEIISEPDGLPLETIRAELKNCRMYVRDQYVKIRDQNHNIMILDKFDFSEIRII